MSQKIYRQVVSSSHEGMRLDQYLAGEIEELSRIQARKVIDLGGVHVNGRRVGRCSAIVKGGQKIEVHLDGRPLDIFEFDSTHILYQDSYLLAVYKPAGMEFQPTHARFKGTVYDTVLRYLETSGSGKGGSIGMVQRLDRDTSGVTIFSIHPKAHRGLTNLFTERKVEKHYLALVSGQLLAKEGRYCSLLARQHRTNRMKSVAKGGKEAITNYRVVEEFPQASLVEVNIETGRSHQIRVHFSEAGHPLLGDIRYDGSDLIEKIPIHRQMLHAWRLQFVHPVTGETLCLTAPLPPDMTQVMELLRGKLDSCNAIR